MKRVNSGKRNNILLLNQWVHVLARIFGFWSFHIDFKRMNLSNAVQLKITDLFCITAAMTVYIFCIYLQFISFDYFFALHFSMIEMVLYLVTAIMSLLISILTILLNCIYRNVLWRIVLIFYYFDEEVREIV